ncbi:hypothetical protein V8F20_010422 [Naviculisporaceae sp. PSN 640]
MGSIQKKNGKPEIPNLPTVKLDTTLINLYRLAGPPHVKESRLGMVFGLVNSGIELTSFCPRNTKFLYQDSPFITIPRDKLTKHNRQLHKALTIRYLNLIPQRDAFISGKTPTIMFHRGQTPSQKAHDKRQAEETFSVLDSTQKPEVIFGRGPSDLPSLVKDHDIQHLTYKMVADGLASLFSSTENPGLILHDPETHYRLNTKAALATSGLPTPATQVLELDPPCPPCSPAECCPHCAASHQASIKTSQLPVISRECTGPRGEWQTIQRERVLEAIKARDMPFVVKTQQTFGGAGTWVITTEEEKEKLSRDLSSEERSLIDRLLVQVTPQNAHLKPAAMLISEFVANPVNDYGITFVVTSDHDEERHSKDEGKAKAIFLAVSEQIIDPSSRAWLGSTIDYSHQEYLREKFEELIGQTAEWIIQTSSGAKYGGYFGPVGIDVLESKVVNSAEDANGEDKEETSRFDIVDLNVRPSGSLALPLLRGHFTSRGLNLASSLAIRVRGGREGFLQRWKKEFEEGRMLVLSWYEDYGDDDDQEDDNEEDHDLTKTDEEVGEGRREVVWSYGDVVVGAEDRTELMGLLDRVRACSEEVTF